MLKQIPFLLVAISLSGPAFAATYYVATTGSNSNTGDQGSPWLTIQKAATTAAAGDTVNIAAGTYSGNVTFANSGTAGNPITFLGPGATITGNVDVTGDYVTLSGPTVSPPSAGGNLCAIALNGQYDTLEGCTVTNYGATASDQATAIGFGGAYDLVQGCTVDNLNDIDVFHIFGHDNTVRWNTVTNIQEVNYNLNHTDFTQTWGDSYNVLIEGNLVANSSCQLGNTECDNATASSPANNCDNVHDWTFRNNVFVNVANPLFSGIPNTFIYNNVFDNVGSTIGYPISFYTITDPVNLRSSAGSQIINNVFLNTGTLGSDGTDLSTLTTTNNYFGTASYGMVSGANGSPVINGGNPEFVDAGFDFHLQATSPLIGQGANLYSLFVGDKDGNLRPDAGPWDIGPYEYCVGAGCVPAPDAGGLPSSTSGSAGTTSAATTTGSGTSSSGTTTGTSGATSSGTSGANCETSSATFQSVPFAVQTGSFTVEFDATPQSADIDGITGLSSGPASQYSDLAISVRFNDTGSIDALNGAAYAAASTIPYTAGTSYHFRVTVDLTAHTYDASVTPAGGTAQLIGSAFAFRTAQNTVTTLDHWTVEADSGSHGVCNFVIDSASAATTGSSATATGASGTSSGTGASGATGSSAATSTSSSAGSTSGNASGTTASGSTTGATASSTTGSTSGAAAASATTGASAGTTTGGAGSVGCSSGSGGLDGMLLGLIAVALLPRRRGTRPAIIRL